MKKDSFSAQGRVLIDFYTEMATDGYKTIIGNEVAYAFADFELRKFRIAAKAFFKQNEIKTILDYGSGGSDWEMRNFDPDSGLSAKNFFDLEHIINYEPARGRDDLSCADCVTCIDVMEHIFLTDIPAVMNDIFSHAKKAVMLNIACYSAAALLPNGENAHISVRDPLWWKAAVDMASIKFPDITILLICSVTHTSGIVFTTWKARDWMESESLTIPPPQGVHFGEQP